MGDKTAKIRIKLGSLEIEYEGRESFLEDDIFNLIKKTLSFYTEHKGVIPAEPTAKSVAGTESHVAGFDQSTNTIASHLGANSGPELVVAAAAHLMLVKGQNKFARKEINDEMKDATTYYKASMTTNLSKYLGGLVKAKRLNLVSKGVYALSASEKKSLEAKLAQ